MTTPSICNSESKQPFFPDLSTLCARWAVPVTDLSEVTKPDRDHAYILPDNSVWILNYDGTGMIQLASSGDEGQPTMIKNDDGYLIVTGSGTHDVTIDVNYDELMSDFYTKNETDDRIFDAVIGEKLTSKVTIDFKGKTSGSTTENPSISGNYLGASLWTPSISYSELSQAAYEWISDLDNKLFSPKTQAKDFMSQEPILIDLVGQIEKDSPALFKNFSAETRLQKAVVLRKLITNLHIKLYGYGSGASGNRYTLNIRGTNSTWYGGQNHTSSDVQMLQIIIGQSNNYLYIHDNGYIYLLASAPASDGVTPSILNTDYVSLDYTLTTSATDIYALKSETYTKTEVDSKLSLKADISKAQMSKITTDAGGALSTIGSGASLFDWIVAQGLGYRTIIVSSAASDIPKISSTFRGIVQNVSSNATGNVKLISDTGRYFIRSFYQGAWSSGWTELTGSGSSSNYWAFFNSAYTSLTVGATGNKTERVVSIAGTDYSDGIYDSQSDTTSWSIPFALDSTSLLSYLIVYSDSTKTKQEFVYSLNTDINMNELKSTSTLTILGRKGIDVTKVADNNYLLQLQQKGIYTTNNTFSLMFSQLGNINQIRLNILSTLLMEGASGPITFKEVVSSINYNPVSIYPVQFFVEAAARNFSTGSKYENYTLTGYYQLEKDSTDDKYYFELVIDGMYTYDFEIPYLSASRVSDPNNLLSESSTSTDEFVFRPKTVFI